MNGARSDGAGFIGSTNNPAREVQFALKVILVTARIVNIRRSVAATRPVSPELSGVSGGDG